MKVERPKPNQKLWSIIEDVEGNKYYQLRVAGKILKTIRIESTEEFMLKKYGVL